MGENQYSETFYGNEPVFKKNLQSRGNIYGSELFPKTPSKSRPPSLIFL